MEDLAEQLVLAPLTAIRTAALLVVTAAVVVAHLKDPLILLLALRQLVLGVRCVSLAPVVPAHFHLLACAQALPGLHQKVTPLPELILG